VSNSLVSGWRKEDSKRHRRAAVLKRCYNDRLKAEQAMLGLYNRSRDPEVRRLARADRVYFKVCRKNRHKNG